jgi:hypothetical protein
VGGNGDLQQVETLRQLVVRSTGQASAEETEESNMPSLTIILAFVVVIAILSIASMVSTHVRMTAARAAFEEKRRINKLKMDIIIGLLLKNGYIEFNRSVSNDGVLMFQFNKEIDTESLLYIYYVSVTDLFNNVNVELQAEAADLGFTQKAETGANFDENTITIMEGFHLEERWGYPKAKHTQHGALPSFRLKKWQEKYGYPATGFPAA